VSRSRALRPSQHLADRPPLLLFDQRGQLLLRAFQDRVVARKVDDPFGVGERTTETRLCLSGEVSGVGGDGQLAHDDARVCCRPHRRWRDGS